MANIFFKKALIKTLRHCTKSENLTNVKSKKVTRVAMTTVTNTSLVLYTF